MDEQTASKPISSVLLVGGTHGNELTGIKLVEHWQKCKKELTYKEFELSYLIANPKACQENKRYLDQDLNRCFQLSDLNNPSLEGVEQKRAKEINQQIGPKGNSKTDFIIDLHTSTANMQTNIVITKIDQFHLQLAAYLKQQLDDVVITSEVELMDDHHFLNSVADKRIVIEIGPIPQGSIDYSIYQLTEDALLATLEFADSFDKDNFFELPDNLEVMSYYQKLKFPTDESGNISACVHPNLIGKTYPTIEHGDPIFISFDGEDILYEGEKTQAAFINEAAYYDQGIAMSLCRSRIFSLNTCLPIDNINHHSNHEG